MDRQKGRPITKIQHEILRALILMAAIMALLLTAVSIAVNVHSEQESLDHNLINIGKAIAGTDIVCDALEDRGDTAVLETYLDSLKNSLDDIDVISVVGLDSVRRYHSNHELIAVHYDGTMPDFEANGSLYTTSDTGPSGPQRRAYAAVYDHAGNYVGFVLAIMLRQNIDRMIWSTVLIHFLCALAAVGFAAVISMRLAGRIKGSLLGYEPDAFRAMFSVRDEILESLEEGIIALDSQKRAAYMNGAARKMLGLDSWQPGQALADEAYPSAQIDSVLRSGEKQLSVPVSAPTRADILCDCMPVSGPDGAKGALCILHDRSEYTKLMEDLSGVRYMVESMRANNHDFTNKLHVILGLIQMGASAQACEYITNITTVQQPLIHSIMQSIDDPSVAALLIGKYSRASELNIRYSIESGSRLSREDIAIPSGDLVTIIGNLVENAMDAMNTKKFPPRELSVGIFTSPHAMIINVDDTGPGMERETAEKIFENGFSTKGPNRGTGLYAVKGLVDKYGGDIRVESEPGVGTSFTVTLTDRGGGENV